MPRSRQPGAAPGVARDCARCRRRARRRRAGRGARAAHGRAGRAGARSCASLAHICRRVRALTPADLRGKQRPTKELSVLRVGLVGWRGMVGSVLMDRMRQCGDFDGIEATFFSTSDVGGQGPAIGGRVHPLHDAYDLGKLKQQDVLISCQGGGYTTDVIGRLRGEGFQGYFIDAASTLRMESDAVLVLDPVNLAVIKQGLASGCKTFVGANCTVSLMLMGMH